MGLIDPMRYDAFFSYAHDDNVLNDDAVWLFRDYFKRKFTAEVRRRLNRSPRDEAEIFMDRSGLPANGDLSGELAKAVEASVFLVIFVGKWYPESDWCGRELATFLRQFDGDRRAALNRTFIIVLEKEALGKNWGTNLEVPDRPIHQPFYDERTGHLIPLVLEGPDGQAVQSPRFSGRLRRVVETMADRALEEA